VNSIGTTVEALRFLVVASLLRLLPPADRNHFADRFMDGADATIDLDVMRVTRQLLNTATAVVWRSVPAWHPGARLSSDART